MLETLTSIEVVELGLLKVKGIRGKILPIAAQECILLANLLKVAIELHWNDKVIMIYVNTTIEQIITDVMRD